MHKDNWIQRFLITATLSLGLWTVLSYLLPAKPSSSEASGLFWHNKIHTSNRYDLVFVGDSRIYRGIDPASVEQTFADLGSAIKVFNFGFSSAGLDSAFIEDALSLLDTNAALPILVLGISPSALADENMTNTHYYQEKNRSFTEQLQRKYLSTFLANFDPSTPSLIRNQILENKQGYFQEHYMNGWIASEKIPTDLWKDLWMLEDGFKKADWSLRYQIQLIQLIAQWEKKGIQVFAFRPPAAAHFEKAENKWSQFSESAIAAQIEAVGGNWIQLPNRYQYQTYDGSHLTKESAQKMSSDIAKKISKQLFGAYQRVYNTSHTMELDRYKNWSDLSPEICADTAYQSARSNLLHPESFSSTFSIPMRDVATGHLQIKANTWLLSKQYKTLKDAYLVIALEKNDSSIIWDAQPVQNQVLDTLGWNRIQHQLEIRHEFKEALLKVYVWNNSSKKLWIDDFEVQINNISNND